VGWITNALSPRTMKRGCRDAVASCGVEPGGSEDMAQNEKVGVHLHRKETYFHWRRLHAVVFLLHPQLSYAAPTNIMTHSGYQVMPDGCTTNCWHADIDMDSWPINRFSMPKLQLSLLVGTLACCEPFIFLGWAPCFCFRFCFGRLDE
jgi:hypothetical protein